MAISDHRSSAPTHDELARLASEARVAGLLSGKSGVSFFHLGMAGGLAPLRALGTAPTSRNASSTPPTATASPWRSLPRPSSGSGRRLKVDLTTSSFPDLLDDGERLAADALVALLAAACPWIASASASDANASLPRFDGEGDSSSCAAAR